MLRTDLLSVFKQSMRVADSDSAARVSPAGSCTVGPAVPRDTVLLGDSGYGIMPSFHLPSFWLLFALVHWTSKYPVSFHNTQPHAHPTATRGRGARRNNNGSLGEFVAVAGSGSLLSTIISHNTAT